MTLGKTIRVLGVSLALLSLLVFATVVSSGWHDHGSDNDSHCPYCHLGHQAAAQPETGQRVAVLSPVASLPLPKDLVQAASPVFFQTPSRAPPAL
jgi:hypothetical protein